MDRDVAIQLNEKVTAISDTLELISHGVANDVSSRSVELTKTKTEENPEVPEEPEEPEAPVEEPETRTNK